MAEEPNDGMVSLSTLGRGAAIERFDDEFKRVLENILDPNTADGPRALSLRSRSPRTRSVPARPSRSRSLPPSGGRRPSPP